MDNDRLLHSYYVGYDMRLKDIEARYGKESEVYINCEKLISYLKSICNPTQE